jgi:hypothetical protein
MLGERLRHKMMTKSTYVEFQFQEEMLSENLSNAGVTVNE